MFAGPLPAMRCKDILTVVVAFRPRLVNWPWTVGRLKTIAKSIVVAYEKWIPFKAWLLWLTLRLAWLPEIWYRSIRMPRLSFLPPFALTRPHCHTRQSPHPLTTIFIGEFWYANVFRNAIWNKSLSQKKSIFSVVRISQRSRIYLTWWMNRELEPHLVHLKSRTFVVFLVALVKPSQCVYASTLKRLC